MTRAIIEVRDLSKTYRLGSIGASTLREEFSTLYDRLRRGAAADDRREFRALRDVSFEVATGQVLGIVGRNGAGKSTLLKILSRITEPTVGEAVLRGRVASLLEVGTGFHPELTGRENVYLNGAILGMTKQEIKEKFDEIVAFAEVERFLDTPVKRYSSGMYVRLAFAVAAHLSAEILVVDEVLAVGDAAFQTKCLQKMQGVSHEQGRTVLFVSHNMAAVERLCDTCILIEEGRVTLMGPPTEIVHRYLGGMGGSQTRWDRQDPLPAHSHFRHVSFQLEDGAADGVITTQTLLDLRIVVEVVSRDPALRLGVILHGADGLALFSSGPMDTGVPYPTEVGTHEYRLRLADPSFMAQRYSVTVSLYAHRQAVDVLWHVLNFDVQEVASMINLDGDTRMGVLQVRARWSGSQRSG